MSKIYEIDPYADTLVIVRPSVESFAPWTDHNENGSMGAVEAKVNGTTIPGEVRIKVSSKHLSLASPYFRDHFAWTSNGATTGTTTPATSVPGLWGMSKSLGGTIIQADGRMHVVLDGLDGAATITVLNIVHGRGGSERVPKTVELDTLARIAVVVDRFQLQEAVDVYADRWISDLYRRGLPTRNGRDLVLWIYVAYVFQRAEIFQQVTAVAATQSVGPLPILPGLPLRAKIVQDVDAQRQQAVAASLDVLHGAVDMLVREDNKTGAEDDADAVLLGSMMRTLRRSGLAWPRPDAPYTGISVASISRVAHNVQTQVWRLASYGNGSTSKQLLISPKLDSLRTGIAGLDLKSDHGYRLY